MANETFTGIANKVLLRCPTAPLTLARDWVKDSFRDVVERRRWSWLMKTGQLTTPDAYTTGTASVTAGTQTVTITTGVVSADHIGRQFRIGTALPIVTITDADTVANTFEIDQAWWPTTQTNKAFSVYQAYLPLPSDFHSFFSVIDPATAYPLSVMKSVEWLDNNDPQRSLSGSTPRILAWRDYRNGLPRYELWPHQRSAAVYPMVYESRPTDPFDAGATVPALLPANILLERAMMYCAMWPGTVEKPNPYFGNKMNLAETHREEYERQLLVLEKQDNQHMQQNVWYQSDQRANTPILSGRWMQEHDLG